MTLAAISVPEIHCDMCKNAIEGALRPLPGVERADVDVPARTVSVRFAEPATIDELCQAIEGAGYQVAETR